MIVPSLHYWEVANVLRTYVRRRELAERLARDIYDLHIEAPLETVAVERSEVLDTAIRYEATAYDAIYISLCLRHDVPLLTAEKTTTPWVVKLGDRVESVR